MSSFIVREATFSDVNRITELRLMAQQHFEKSNPSIWRMTKEGERLLKQKVENDLMDDNVQVLVAEAGSETVGFIRGEIADRNDYSPRIVGSISLMYVIERFRRNGIGRRLVKELCTSFNSKGIEYLTVRYIIGNKEAEQFWQELDFDPIIITAMTNPRKLESRLKTAIY